MMPMTFAKPDLTARAIAFSWLVAPSALAFSVLVAVIGQGLGASLGDADWIGISTPIHRSCWALVNQPNLAFAASRDAIGYWLGSIVAGLGLSLGIGLFLSRSSNVASQLIAIQYSWSLALVTGAWYPLSDPGEGHLERFLALQRLPGEIVWLAPLIAAVAAIPAVLRLLALGRGSRSSYSAPHRVFHVFAVFLFPLIGWLVACAIMAGRLPIEACIACAAPLGAALIVAVVGWGQRPVIDPRPIALRSWCWAAVVGVLLAGAVYGAGRPLPSGGTVGILWNAPNGFNNIRGWIDARTLAEWTSSTTDQDWPAPR